MTSPDGKPVPNPNFGLVPVGYKSGLVQFLLGVTLKCTETLTNHCLMSISFNRKKESSSDLSEDLKTQTQICPCHHTVSPNTKLSCGQSDLDVGLGSWYLFNQMHMLKTQVEKK